MSRMFRLNRGVLDDLVRVKSYNLGSSYNLINRSSSSDERRLSRNKLIQPIILYITNIKPIYDDLLNFLFYGVECWDGESKKWTKLDRCLENRLIFGMNDKEMERQCFDDCRIYSGSVILLMQTRLENKESLVEAKVSHENYNGVMVSQKRRYKESNMFEEYTIVLMDMYVIGKMDLQLPISLAQSNTEKLNKKISNKDEIDENHLRYAMKNSTSLSTNKDENVYRIEKEKKFFSNDSASCPDVKTKEKGLFMNAVYYPSNSKNYTKLNDLTLKNKVEGKLVNVIGVCVDIEDPISIKRRDHQQQYTNYGGCSSSVRSSLLKFWLMDNTNVRVCVAVWGIRAYELSIKKGAIYCINKAHLKFYKEPILNVLSDGAINQVADTYTSWNLVNDVRDWWKNVAEKSNNMK